MQVHKLFYLLILILGINSGIKSMENPYPEGSREFSRMYVQQIPAKYLEEALKKAQQDFIVFRDGKESFIQQVMHDFGYNREDVQFAYDKELEVKEAIVDSIQEAIRNIQNITEGAE